MKEMKALATLSIIVATCSFVFSSCDSTVPANGNTPFHFDMKGSLPAPAIPGDNPLTEEGIELGRQLFYDKLLSRTETQSCGGCHALGNALDDSLQFSVGVRGLKGNRNAMPIFNLVFDTAFFWDGRSPSLRDQVLRPIQDTLEMDESLANVLTKLQSSTKYKSLFKNAFGNEEITIAKMALALEQFLMSIISVDSKADQVRRGERTFTAEEKRGEELYFKEYVPGSPASSGADCFHCHQAPLFRTRDFENNGLDSDGSMKDLGRFSVTSRESDKGRFKIPSLRNVSVTAPYMHDGRFRTLEEVVEHYSSGLKNSATISSEMSAVNFGGVGLTSADKKALVAYLKTLTDSTYLTNSRYAAPR